jgi:hypothetical protein
VEQKKITRLREHNNIGDVLLKYDKKNPSLKKRARKKTTTLPDDSLIRIPHSGIAPAPVEPYLPHHQSVKGRASTPGGATAL